MGGKNGHWLNKAGGTGYNINTGTETSEKRLCKYIFVNNSQIVYLSKKLSFKIKMGKEEGRERQERDDVRGEK